MRNELLKPEKFSEVIINRTPIIDVRAPVEFNEGALPESVNLPIMMNEERAQVGTCYKKFGREAAIQLGEALVSGELKMNRVQSWRDCVHKNPEAIITCFRGGLRSKITQDWLRESGIATLRIEGGYKAFRNFLIEETVRLSYSLPVTVVTGATGVGKTILLQEVRSAKPVLDLEALAGHRGSAFGGMGRPQPGQIDFENKVAAELIRLEKLMAGHKTTLILEDESRLIGVRAVPATVFEKIRSSSVVLVSEELSVRVENTFAEYVLFVQDKESMFANFQLAIQKISKRLGGLRAQEILKDISDCKNEFKDSGNLDRNKIWIEKILHWYYDPMYLGSLKKRNPQILFKGTRDQVRSFLMNE